MTRNKIIILIFLALFIIANTFVLINLQSSNAEIREKLTYIEKEEFLNYNKFTSYLSSIKRSNVKYKNVEVFDRIDKVYNIIKTDSTKIYDPDLKKELFDALSSFEDFKSIKIKDFNSNILTLLSIGMEMSKVIKKSNGYPEQRLIIENLKKSSDGKISFSLAPILFESHYNHFEIKILNEKNQLISTRSAFIYSGDYNKLVAEFENKITKEKCIYTNITESNDEE